MTTQKEIWVNITHFRAVIQEEGKSKHQDKAHLLMQTLTRYKAKSFMVMIPFKHGFKHQSLLHIDLNEALIHTQEMIKYPRTLQVLNARLLLLAVLTEIKTLYDFYNGKILNTSDTFVYLEAPKKTKDRKRVFKNTKKEKRQRFVEKFKKVWL